MLINRNGLRGMRRKSKYIPEKYIKRFFEVMNDNDIQYVLIKNIFDELPCKLPDGKDIDILVHTDSKEKFEECMSANGFGRRIPPNGKENGWSFAYQLPEYEFWQMEKNKFTFYIDANFKLCCKSLMGKIWIPLDNSIQEELWKNKVFDAENNWWIMDEYTILVYLLVRAVFDKENFRAGYIEGIEKRKHLIAAECVKEKLSKIFFNYTDRLIHMVNEGKYSEIVQDYRGFREY